MLAGNRNRAATWLMDRCTRAAHLVPRPCQEGSMCSHVGFAKAQALLEFSRLEVSLTPATMQPTRAIDASRVAAMDKTENAQPCAPVTTSEHCNGGALALPVPTSSPSASRPVALIVASVSHVHKVSRVPTSLLSLSRTSQNRATSEILFVNVSNPTSGTRTQSEAHSDVIQPTADPLGARMAEAPLALLS